LAQAVDRWQDRRVVVVGDVILDDWRYTEPRRLYREAPAPVLALRGQQDAAGGAGNTAVNLASLGARPVLVAPIGDDAAAVRVKACLTDAGVSDATVSVPGHRTPRKRRLIAGGQILCCEEEIAAGEGRSVVAEVLVQTLQQVVRPGDDLVICDYGLGALDDRVHWWLAEHRAMFGVLAVDAHDLSRWGDVGPTVVTPNLVEAAPLLSRRGRPGVAPDRAAAVIEGATMLLARTGAQTAAVTMDVDGSVVVTASGQRYRTRTRPAPGSNTVGAGDAYLAAFALAVAVDATMPVAAELAQLAAGATLDDTGTCVCTRDGLLASVTRRAPHRGARVLDAAGLTQLVRGRREQGACVVFTNGCFDVLHSGHVQYLAQARELGDLLIVAVNSDASVRRLKGAQRPVNREADRVAVLAALSCVDVVVVFEEDSPAALIEAVRPEVYVKGGDYPPELVPEAPLVRRLGGEVRILGYVPDRSTSAIIERIRAREPLSPTRPAP
jgi:rfaE bifunctional protein nucleotidyltransferase chain/domain/rfaE bifunctional protein kinase chain/domain